MDVRAVGLDRQGPVALGQGLVVPAGLLEDQGPLQVVAGRRRVFGRRQRDRTAEVRERLAIVRTEPVNTAQGAVQDCLVRESGDRPVEHLRRVVEAPEVLIGLGEVDVRLELVGPSAIAARKSSAAWSNRPRRTRITPRLTSMTYRLASSRPQLRRLREVGLGQVELAHLPFGEALEEVSPDEAGPGSLADRQRGLGGGRVMLLEVADRQKVLAPEMPGLVLQDAPERRDGLRVVAPAVGGLTLQEVVDRGMLGSLGGARLGPHGLGPRPVTGP